MKQNTEIELSPDQQAALERIVDWLEESPEQTMTLGGYAGTGKTTLIRVLMEYAHRVAVVAYTGKAVSVLRKKGVPATTVHSLFYRFRGKDDEQDPIFVSSDKVQPGLVIVDEASMIDRRMHQDLEDTCRKILYIGDHGQLKPIGYDPGLMRDPQIRLEKIHRQAAQSGIVDFAAHARKGGKPHGCGELPDVSVEGYYKTELDSDEDKPCELFARMDLTTPDAFLCYTNRSRHALNEVIRKARGFEGDIPNVGETLICLQNDKVYDIHNGMQMVVKEVVRVYENVDGYRIADIVFDVDGEKRGPISVFVPQFGKVQPGDPPHWITKSHTKACWNDEELYGQYAFMDWGYALTVHKAQGSEWDTVCILEETIHTSEARWRYTAITRAAKSLIYYAPKKKVYTIDENTSPAVRRMMERKRRTKNVG